MEKKKQFIKKFGILFELFSDKELLGVGFFFAVAVRKLIFAIFLVVFNNYPAVDLFAFLLLNGGMVYLVIKKKPYKKKIFAIRDLVSETCFASIHIISLLLLFGDYASNKKMLGIVIVGMCLMILSAHLICLIIEAYQLIALHCCTQITKKNEPKIE